MGAVVRVSSPATSPSPSSVGSVRMAPGPSAAPPRPAASVLEPIQEPMQLRRDAMGSFDRGLRLRRRPQAPWEKFKGLQPVLRQRPPDAPPAAGQPLRVASGPAASAEASSQVARQASGYAPARIMP